MAKETPQPTTPPQGAPAGDSGAQAKPDPEKAKAQPAPYKPKPGDLVLEQRLHGGPTLRTETAKVAAVYDDGKLDLVRATPYGETVDKAVPMGVSGRLKGQPFPNWLPPTAPATPKRPEPEAKKGRVVE